MFRRLGLYLVVLAALVVVPGASAAFPGPYAVQGGDGVLSPDHSLRFVALKAGASTLVRANPTSDSAVAMSQTIPGAFGVPTLTVDGPGSGMFRDGSTFVLQSMGLQSSTQFVLLRTADLSTRDQINLKGTFGFDALSPDGSMLYLIQHRTTQDVQHYIVRAYDLSTHKLLPNRIADKTQASWVMQGWAVSRAESSDGRWAYTLYANPGGTPFVHALDTVKGVAHCVGVPWSPTDSNQTGIFRAQLDARRDEARGASARRRCLPVHQYDELEGVEAALARRGRDEEVLEELGQELGLPQRQVVIGVDLDESRAGNVARDMRADRAQLRRIVCRDHHERRDSQLVQTARAPGRAGPSRCRRGSRARPG